MNNEGIPDLGLVKVMWLWISFKRQMALADKKTNVNKRDKRWSRPVYTQMHEGYHHGKQKEQTFLFDRWYTLTKQVLFLCLN